MKKIMLVCNGGMSTSILARQIRDASNGEFEVDAYPEATYSEHLTDDIHVILVGPQIRYLVPDIQKVAGSARTVQTIDLRTYGLMDGKKVIKQIQDIYKEHAYD